MYIYNITFVMSPDSEERFYGWLRESALPVLMAGEFPPSDPRIHKVVETGGEKPGPEHGLSMALHVEFPTEEAAHEWHDTRLPQALADFNRKFGPYAAFFITMLEVSRL
ncbi:MAG: DUF4286 family protein [Muribaculaceae bacterium]|nr:DUF4286 family protein [Muribaculaceae bacterium]